MSPLLLLSSETPEVLEPQPDSAARIFHSPAIATYIMTLVKRPNTNGRQTGGKTDIGGIVAPQQTRRRRVNTGGR